ncbi:hypothetical protein T459_34322 [Capsicum annuum]|uniref:Uncharacterized protein n=1 Tax=Capsicum annuum TaxID=4072 RepID=A0A2G2XWE5_CAPAN|nr:hypothetical protein T459_34322 [Capsicum annuum]
MKKVNQTLEESSNTGVGYYQDSVTLVTKGLEHEVVSIFSLYTAVDFSSNRFEGHILGIMGDLIALRVLNLSHNELQGHIPPSLGNLPLVESLDLSSNHLVGKKPEQLTSLTFLQFLNLSHNHLQGCILTGRQFATFENNSYTELPVNLFQSLEAMKRFNQTRMESSNTGVGYYQDSVSWKINTALRVLNLSHNELQDHIPTSLGNLPSVESLDLSSNHLEGKIPEQLTSLTFLEFFNLSHNQLHGCIPTGGYKMFRNSFPSFSINVMPVSINSSQSLSLIRYFSLFQNMTPKRRTQPVQEDPLGDHVSHAEFRAAFTTLDQSVAAQNE